MRKERWVAQRWSEKEHTRQPYSSISSSVSFICFIIVGNSRALTLTVYLCMCVVDRDHGRILLRGRKNSCSFEERGKLYVESVFGVGRLEAHKQKQNL